MLAVLLVMVPTHVPTYDTTCVDNCCVPPHTYTTSQVIYLKGSGGLELHLEDVALDATLDVDAVFRDEVDPSTYRLYVGCGGCVPSDPIVVPPIRVDGYQPAEVEPFTQTAYRSVFAPSERKFDASVLSTCDQGHFTIRLVDFGNRTTGSEDIVWGPVIGLGESFTIEELLSFPLYILRNHGDTWNELGYTYWLFLFIVAPFIVFWFRRRRTRVCVSPLRDVLYDVALVGFLAAALEELTHLIYAQLGTPVGFGFWTGLFVVILFGQGVGVLFVQIVRNATPGSCAAHPAWAPLEVVTGVSLLLLLGAGFYLGPAAIVLAGTARGIEALCHRPSSPEDIEVIPVPPQRRVISPRSYGPRPNGII